MGRAIKNKQLRTLSVCCFAERSSVIYFVSALLPAIINNGLSLLVNRNFIDQPLPGDVVDIVHPEFEFSRKSFLSPLNPLWTM